MSYREPTREEQAAAGNGDMQEWIEHEAEVNRDLAEYRGRGDPDPKYDLAPLLGQGFCELAFLDQMEDFWNAYEDNGDRDPTESEGQPR